jgi:PAS domain S-box-containing protein
MMGKPNKAKRAGRGRYRAAAPPAVPRSLLYARPELQLIYDTVPIGLAFLTPDGRYVQINQRLTEICGISVADHIGRSVRETVPQVADLVERIIQDAMRTGEAVTGVEVHGQRADKLNADRVWITNWHPLRSPDGSIVGINVVAEEITERKRTETVLTASEMALRETEVRFHELADNISQFAWTADRSGWIYWYNKRWHDYTGTTLEEMQGWGWQKVHHPDHVDRVVNRKTLRFESRFRHKDGTFRWISWKAVPDGQRIYAMGRDITELRDAQQKLLVARRELAEVTHRTTLVAMSAAIAHEIKQPLAAIVANANAGLRWLTATPPGLDQACDTFRDIAADGHRADDVIRSVQAMFSRIDQPRTMFDVNELIRETIALARGELEAARIAVELGLASELPPIYAHRVQLQQVVLNVVTNAADAMRPITDRARVLRIESKPFNSTGVEVAVKDSGTGIEPENVARIFDAFFTTKANGMGMGLAICRSILEAHGGTLSVSPSTPHGSVFRLALPSNR